MAYIVYYCLPIHITTPYVNSNAGVHVHACQLSVITDSAVRHTWCMYVNCLVKVATKMVRVNVVVF